MLEMLQSHINSNFPQLRGKRLLLAISGGIDSMVLVHLLHQLNFQIAIAHCNFKLRGIESEADENFVKQFAFENKIPFYSISFQTERYAIEHKLSIQLAARKLRYEWFDQILEEEKYDYLLTAHHLDDQIETFLINFTRGTGLEGLTGIPSQNGKIIRPLLPFSRDQIEFFAQENAITWREDLSNASPKYLRNKLRHTVVPILKELNTSFMHSFQQTLDHLKQSQSLVDDASQNAYRKVVQEKDYLKKINISALKALQNYEAYLFQWLKPLGFSAWKDIYELVHAQSGKQVLSESYMLLKDREYLIIAERNKENNLNAYSIEKGTLQVKNPINIVISKVDSFSNKTNKTIFVDEDKIIYPLIIRKWKEGDVFFPSGMQGKKKVSKYFKDEKFSQIDKQNQWLLCSNDEIIWIINHRADERFVATNKTKNILKLETKK